MKLHVAPINLATLFLSACAICQAGTIYTLNQTITLNSSLITSSGGAESYNQEFSNTSSVTVQAGDEITGTISFTNGPILLQAPTGINEDVAIYLSPASGGSTDGFTGNLDFSGLTGIDGTTNPTPTNSVSGGPLVAYEYTGGNTPVDFSFTGLTYKINISSLSPSPDTFYISQFSLGAQNITFGSTAPTAEPSSLGLGGLGCGALAWVRRRRRAIA
jgi:hypothetical protein